MAKNLLLKGYAVTIKGHKNRAPVDDLVRQGATEVATSAQVARQSDVVFLCVTGTPQVEEVVFGELKPVLQAFCENVVHVGPPGAGHVVKLANNFIAMTIACATAEAGAAVKRMGVDPQQFVDVVSLGAVDNGIFQAVLAQTLQGNYAALKFALNNARKDIRYFTHMTENLPMTSIMGEATHQSLVNAYMLGFGEEFVPSLIKAQEKLNGTRIAG